MAVDRSSAYSSPTNSNGRLNEQGAGGGRADVTLNIDHSMSSNNGRRPAVCPDNWKELLHWLGTGGAFLSCTFTTIFMGSFGSFMAAQILWVCWGIVVLTPMVSLGVGPSWTAIWKFLQEHKPADVDRIPERPVGAGESPGILLKVSLAFALLGFLVDRNPADQLSLACGYSCASRFRESLQAIVIIILLLEGLPALILRRDVVRRYSDWIFIVKYIWQEGNHSILRSWLTKEEGILKLQSFQSSALSYVIIFMGTCLLGGNFGTFMTKWCYWLVWSIMIAEFIAEGMYRFPLPSTGQRELLQASGWKRKATNAFRALVQSSLSIGLITTAVQDTFYPSSLPASVCDDICRRNTKALLIVKCGCTFAQAVSLPTAPLQSLSVLLLLPLLLYSALALTFTCIAVLALIAVVTVLAGALLALAAAAVGIVSAVAVPVAVATAVLSLLYKIRSFFKSKKFVAILVVIAVVLLIGSVKEREWPWFYLQHWGVVVGRFFRRLWKGMTHAPST